MDGKRISHFRILEKIGAGGMGEVYKAEDVDLGREVAIKVLPAHLVEDEDRIARFTTEARTAALQDLQARLRDATRKASTVGYGPRFLHSTGQLHKGGTPSGCFIQLTNGHPQDLDIPGRDESFGVLVDAQAMGDFAAFGAHQLPAIRIDLGDDADVGLAALQSALVEALA